MLTAQVVLIIAAVIFIAVSITGSGLFVKVKIPELKPWGRWVFGIVGAGLLASAFLIPGVASRSSGQAISPSPASTGPIDRSPSLQSTKSLPTEPVISGPIVRLIFPSNGTPVPQARGFVAQGTVSQLGNDTIWLTDYDGGYTVDNEATVNGDGAWSASDTDLGNSGESLPFYLTIRVILADSRCAATLQATSNTDSDYLTSLPGGCVVVGGVTVRVTTP
jgi:hypothetical protein